MQKFRTAAGVLAGFVMLVSFIPQPAYAQLAVIDAANLAVNSITSGATSLFSSAYNLKEGIAGSGIGLDTIAWTVSKMAIQSMTKSLVNWINSGFKGSPAFVTDLEGHLQQVGDAVARPFLSDLGSNASLRSPFQSIVAQAVGNQYYLNSSRNGFFTQAAYTLNQVSPNDKAFLAGDFSQGGIRAFYSAFANPSNNPYGAQRLAEEELAGRVSSAQGTALTRLNWGQGFLSWCDTSGGGAAAGGSGQVSSDAEADAAIAHDIASFNAAQAANPIDLSSSNNAVLCTNKDGTAGVIKTPGSILAGLTTKTLGLSGDQLVTADEFNEIIGALMSQLTSEVIGATGLSGVSSVSSGGNGFIDKAADPSQYAATSGSGSSGGFSQPISAQIQTVTQYQTDWKKIGDEATLANTAAANCAAVTNVLTQATTAATKAASSLTLLQKVQADATLAGTDQSKLALVASEFQQALASPDMPSASDAANAQIQAQDASGSATLFSHMKTIATSGLCS
jgi:hypothetical protein